MSKLQGGFQGENIRGSGASRAIGLSPNALPQLRESQSQRPASSLHPRKENQNKIKSCVL